MKNVTTYVILANTTLGWHVVGGEDAANERAAIKAWLSKEEGGHDYTMFVAVPARSWNPRKVRVETQTRIVLDDVGAAVTASGPGLAASSGSAS